MFESWVEGANEYVRIADEELLEIRRATYHAALDQVDVVEGIENFEKEKGRHREKERLRTIADAIGYSRLMLAKVYFRRKLSDLVTALLVILAVLEFFLERNMIISVLFLGAAVSFFILSVISSRILREHFSSNIVEAYANYGVCEAIIVILDFRGQESIDLERTPVSRRYGLSDLL